MVKFSKITKLVNTYPCNTLIPSTNITLKYIDCCLERLLTVKSKYESITDTGSTSDIDTNYGSLLPYLQISSEYIFTLGNVSKETISGYGKTLVQLGGGGFIWNRNMLRLPGLRYPLYFLFHNCILLGCRYIGYNKGTHTWFPSFSFTIDDRV